MPRHPGPDSKRNTVCVKLTDVQLAAVKAAAASKNMEHSEWVRQAILEACRRSGTMPTLAAKSHLGVNQLAEGIPVDGGAHTALGTNSTKD